MNERWVCKRCFADNEDADARCRSCGLDRNAEVADAERVAWAPAGAASGSDRPAWMGLVRFWWVAALVVVVGVGLLTAARRGDDGSLTSAGTLDVFDLRVGDCFNGDEQTEISEVDGIPCDEPHEYEVFVVEERDGETYPSEAQFDAMFEAICIPAFEEYVGAAYATSALYAGFLTPSEESFSEGDRGYTCYLYEPVDESFTDNVALTGSMRGSGR